MAKRRKCTNYTNKCSNSVFYSSSTESILNFREQAVIDLAREMLAFKIYFRPYGYSRRLILQVVRTHFQ